MTGEASGGEEECGGHVGGGARRIEEEKMEFRRVSRSVTLTYLIILYYIINQLNLDDNQNGSILAFCR